MQMAGVLRETVMWSVVESCTELVSESAQVINVSTLDVDVQTSHDSIASLGDDRACGPDEVPASLLKSGGFATSVKVNHIHRRILRHERWPVNWKRGRLVDLWKRKGDNRVCSNNRGLLISDHIAKSMTSIVKEWVAEPLCAAMPVEQFGGVPGGGTDFASHTIRSIVAYAKVASLSVLTLFLT